MRRIAPFLMAGFIIAAVAGIFVYGLRFSAHRNNRTISEPMLGRPVVKAAKVEDIITRTAVIEGVVNAEGIGNCYLIGQEHYYAGTTSTGPDPNAVQRRSLPHVQAEIYRLLFDLAHEAGLRVVIGEGLNPGELKLPPEQKGLDHQDWFQHRQGMANTGFAIKFFKANPKEAGYAVLELLHPDRVRTFGVDDKRQMEELAAIDRAHFDLANRFIPTRADHEDPAKRKQLAKAVAPLLERKPELNDQRSRIYLLQGMAKADELGERDFAVVIGASHIPLMVQEYAGTRKLYVIRPQSLPDRILPNR